MNPPTLWHEIAPVLAIILAGTTTLALIWVAWRSGTVSGLRTDRDDLHKRLEETKSGFSDERTKLEHTIKEYKDSLDAERKSHTETHQKLEEALRKTDLSSLRTELASDRVAADERFKAQIEASQNFLQQLMDFARDDSFKVLKAIEASNTSIGAAFESSTKNVEAVVIGLTQEVKSVLAAVVDLITAGKVN